MALENVTPGWVTYLRVSDEDKQTPERSFAMQRQRIQEHLLGSSDIPFSREYIDLLSGTNPNRKDYQQMLADASIGRFSHIGLYRADRFGRNTVEGLQAATKLISLGIKIRVANMPSLRPEEPDGFFMFLLQMGLAQREVDVMAQRIVDGMESKLRAGGWVHKAPDGYLNKERLISSNKYERWVEVDPTYKPVIEEAWGLLLEGRYTLSEICEELTRRGYVRVTGRPWAWNDPKTGKRRTAFNTLHKIFHNPFYAGWVTSERFGIKPGQVRGNWEPIITNDQFQCGIQILHKSDKEKSRMKKHTYILRGLLWVMAGAKKLKLFGTTPSGRNQSYSYYTTQVPLNGKNLHLPCEVVEDQIPSWLRGIAIDLKLLPAIRRIYEAEIQQAACHEKKIDLSDLRKQLTQLKEEEARLGRLFVSGKISETAYEQLHAEWQEKLRHVELKLAEMEREPKTYLNDLDIALVLLTRIGELYPRLDDKQKATLLQIIVNQIIVNPRGEIIGHELNSPFVYLQSLVDRLSPPGSREGCGSEQIHVGPPQQTVHLKKRAVCFLTGI